MSDVSAAILFAIETCEIPVPGPVLIMGGEDQKLGRMFPKATVWHPHAADAARWQAGGHDLLDSLATAQRFATVILSCPKQKDETLYLLAQGLSLLDDNGVLIAAADNQANGKILAKLMAGLGPEPETVSKHKCRVIWTKGPADAKACAAAIANGTERQRSDGFITQPGLFSWAGLDRGTQVLLKHLPENLAGMGADFGCGVAVIGRHLLTHHAGITRLYCIDNDSRAISCARQNLAPWQDRTETLWADIKSLPTLPPLDFVVTNPPFHQGKMDANVLGQNFITAAAKFLKAGGRLVLVANLHLPYEALLTREFSSHDLLATEDGFKVIEAVK